MWGGHWLNRTHRDFVCVFVCLTGCLNSCVKRTRVSFLVCGGRHLFTASMKMPRTCFPSVDVFVCKAFHIYFQCDVDFVDSCGVGWIMYVNGAQSLGVCQAAAISTMAHTGWKWYLIHFLQHSSQITTRVRLSVGSNVCAFLSVFSQVYRCARIRSFHQYTHTSNQIDESIRLKSLHINTLVNPIELDLNEISIRLKGMV